MTKCYEFTATLIMAFTIFVITTAFIAKGGTTPTFVTPGVLERE